MAVKLSAEQKEAIAASDGRPLVVVDEQTNEKFVMIDYEIFSWMQCQLDIDAKEAIKRGIADMEAGRTISLQEADRRIRAELGFPPRTTDAAE